MKSDDIHRNTGMKHGPITFVINKNKTRTKIIGTANCGFRSFAYLDQNRANMADAKRSIVYEYEKRRKR